MYMNYKNAIYQADSGRRGGGGLGSSPGQGPRNVVFLGKTLYSHSASLHPGV